jgi:hypothetical protein
MVRSGLIPAGADKLNNGSQDERAYDSQRGPDKVFRHKKSATQQQGRGQQQLQDSQPDGRFPAGAYRTDKTAEENELYDATAKPKDQSEHRQNPQKIGLSFEYNARRKALQCEKAAKSTKIKSFSGHRPEYTGIFSGIARNNSRFRSMPPGTHKNITISCRCKAIRAEMAASGRPEQ